MPTIIEVLQIKLNSSQVLLWYVTPAFQIFSDLLAARSIYLQGDEKEYEPVQQQQRRWFRVQQVPWRKLAGETRGTACGKPDVGAPPLNS